MLERECAAMVLSIEMLQAGKGRRAYSAIRNWLACQFVSEYGIPHAVVAPNCL